MKSYLLILAIFGFTQSAFGWGGKGLDPSLDTECVLNDRLDYREQPIRLRFIAPSRGNYYDAILVVQPSGGLFGKDRYVTTFGVNYASDNYRNFYRAFVEGRATVNMITDSLKYTNRPSLDPQGIGLDVDLKKPDGIMIAYMVNGNQLHMTFQVLGRTEKYTLICRSLSPQVD